MAQMYKVSADTSEKEKAVGGIMTFGQAGWLVLGFIIAASIFLALSQILPPVIGLVLGLAVGGAFGGVFAFYKKEGLALATYFSYRAAFKKKSKLLVNDLAYRKTFEKDDELFQ